MSFDLEIFNEWLLKPNYSNEAFFYVYVENKFVANNIEKYMASLMSMLESGSYNILRIKDIYNDNDLDGDFLFQIAENDYVELIPFSEEDKVWKEIQKASKKYDFFDVNELTEEFFSHNRREVVLVATSDKIGNVDKFNSFKKERIKTLTNSKKFLWGIFSFIYLAIILFAAFQPTISSKILFALVTIIPALFHHNLNFGIKDELETYQNYKNN